MIVENQFSQSTFISEFGITLMNGSISAIRSCRNSASLKDLNDLYVVVICSFFISDNYFSLRSRQGNDHLLNRMGTKQFALFCGLVVYIWSIMVDEDGVIRVGSVTTRAVQI